MRILVPALLLVSVLTVSRASSEKPQPSRLRRPVALVLIEPEQRLLVANRDSGTLAIVDTHSRKTLDEMKVGRRPADVSATPRGERVLVADEEAGEIVLFERRKDVLREARRIAVGVSPVSVQISADGKLATVACLWPRRLAIVDLEACHEPAGVAFVDLSFAPRRQLLLPGADKVLVADSFGGKLAVIDVRGRKIDSLRDLAAHNIRGLALGQAGSTLLVAHQTLYALGRTTRGDIQSGNLILNQVTSFALADLLKPGADVARSSRAFEFGDIDRGAGDPAGVAESADGHIVVALAGVNELGRAVPDKAIRQRLAVGRRPTALLLDAGRQYAYVANTFSDSVSVVELKHFKTVADIALGPTPELRSEERGELLFHDARLSNDAWFSCHSCHSDGHTNGLLNDNFTDGTFGTPKRVLSLLGVKDTGPWAWGGHLAKLEDQIRTSVTSTMQGSPPRAEEVRDLAAYLRTLAPPPSLSRLRGTWDGDAARRGAKVFLLRKCTTCHAGAAFTSPRTYDVGVHDEAGHKEFNPPSLRGLSQSGPYFHDNRASTLHDVLSRHRHALSTDLSREELSDLLHFLNGL